MLHIIEVIHQGLAALLEIILIFTEDAKNDLCFFLCSVEDHEKFDEFSGMK